MREKQTLNKDDLTDNFSWPFTLNKKIEKIKTKHKVAVPEEKPAIIQVFYPTNIPAGDKKNIAFKTIFAKLLGISDPSNYRVQRVVNQFSWEKYPPQKNAGIHHVAITNSIFLSAIYYAYSEDGSSAVKQLIQPLKKKKKSFSSEERRTINQLARLYGRLTDLDVKFYNLYIDKVTGIEKLRKKWKIGSHSVETMKEQIHHLTPFVNLKLEILAKNGLLDKYNYQQPKKGQVNLKDLIERINEISPKLLKRILSEVSFDQPETLTRLQNDFQKEGLESSEVVDFINAFQGLAIKESFKLLKENYRYTKNERWRYEKNKEDFNKLYGLITKKYQPLFWKANYLRAKVVLSFIKKMQLSEYESIVSRDAPAYGHIRYTINKFIAHSKNLKELTKYISEMSPLLFNADITTIFISLTDTDYNFIGFPGLKKDKSVYEAFPDLVKANRMDKDTDMKFRSEGATKFPILADPSLDIRRLSKMNWWEVYSTIKDALDTKKENNKELQNTLREDPSAVWKLELVIDKVLQQSGIHGNAAKIIKDLRKDREDSEWWTTVGIGTMGIALGIAGFFTGGATWAGLLLLGGSVALGSYDLYRTSKQYEFEKSASNTALDAAHELSAIEPSLLGLVLSIIGLGIDVGALSKMVTLGAKALKAGSMSTEAFLVLELQKTFANLTDLNKIDETAKEMYLILGKANIPNKLSQKNFIIKVREIVLESREMTTHNDALLLLMKGTQLEKVAKNLLEGHIGFGLKKIYAHDPKVAEKLIKHFSKNLYVFERFCLEAAIDKNFVDILGDLNKLLGSNWKIYNKTMKYLGSVARADGIRGLNDAISSLKALEKTTPELVSQILVHPKLRKVFYGLEDPEEIVVLWKQFKKEKPQSTFTEFVLNSTKQLNKGTAELRRGFIDADKWMTQLKNFHAHHIIPRKLKKEYEQFLKDIGFNMEDGAMNGIMIPPNKTTLDIAVNKAITDGKPNLAKQIIEEFENSAYHYGSHPDYTIMIEKKLEEIKKLFIENKISPEEALEEVVEITEKARATIKSGQNVPINSIKF